MGAFLGGKKSQNIKSIFVFLKPGKVCYSNVQKQNVFEHFADILEKGK